MAKRKQISTAGLSSKARAAIRTQNPSISLESIHQAIQRTRDSLVANIPTEEVAKERVITAIRNLDVARVVLECNQSLSALDYNIAPWEHLGSMDKILSRKKGAKPANARKR